MLPRLVVLTVLATLTLVAPTSALPAATQTAREEYIVGFYEIPALKPGDRYQGERIVGVDAALRFFVVETLDGPAFRARAMTDANVRYVEQNDPDFGHVTLVPNDPGYSNAGHYGTKKIGAEKAWDRTLGSTTVKVAVLDTGLRKTHEEFASTGRVLQGYDFVNGDTDPNDDCGHGTHVTGTIGAAINNGKGIAGLAQVTLIPVKGLAAVGGLLSVTCTGSTSALASGLRYAGDQGAHVSSNSWGGGTSSALNDAIAYSLSKGVTIVAAAGNDGSCTNCVSEPWKSNAASVIVVSSTDSNDALSSFSSQGPQVDVAAPGTSIYSTYNNANNGYSTLSGTSMATPHVAGVAALIKTLNPTWGYTQIDDRLKTTAVDLGAAGKDDKFGSGRINADAATAGGTPPPNNSPPTASFTFTTSGLTASVNGAGSTDSDGSIASWAWSWGDGTPNGSGSTASHTYAAGGTYSVTLTVTDDKGATGTQTKSVTVSSGGDPDPSTPTLTNGVARSATNGAAGTWQYTKISVPAGKSSLVVVLDGPACGLLSCDPDLDLFVKRGAKPTLTSKDCSGESSSADETCTLSNPAADWWYVGVYVYSGSAKTYTIRATYS